jgi:hypothetical protein
MRQRTSSDPLPAGCPIRIIDGKYARYVGVIVGIRRSNAGLTDYKVLIRRSEDDERTDIQPWVKAARVELAQ